MSDVKSKSGASKLWKTLASVKITVVTLVFSILLVFFGTLAQMDAGIHGVQENFFRSWIIIDEHVYSWFKLPLFPGGFLLGLILVVNLIAAHTRYLKLNRKQVLLFAIDLTLFALVSLEYALKFFEGRQHKLVILLLLSTVVIVAYFVLPGQKFHVAWKQRGLFYIHVGILLLILGEFGTAKLAVETRMSLDEGQTGWYSYDTREPELALVRPLSDEREKAWAIDDGQLDEGATFRQTEWPVELRVLDYYPNARLLGPMQIDKAEHRANMGEHSNLGAMEVARAVRVDDVDQPAAYVEVLRDGKPVGVFLLSVLFGNQKIELGGERWEIALRFRRDYKDWSLKLLDFRHDKYAGSNIPFNFSSKVVLEEANGLKRDVLIWMNHPLRHDGYAIFQYQFANNDRTTVLLFVKNPAWLTPYLACLLVGYGMSIQFLQHLWKFVQKRRKSS